MAKRELNQRLVREALQMFGTAGVGVETLCNHLLGRCDAHAKDIVKKHVWKLRAAGCIDGNFRGRTGKVRWVDTPVISDAQVVKETKPVPSKRGDVTLKKLLTDMGDCTTMMSDLVDEAHAALDALDTDSQMAEGIRKLMEKYGAKA